MKHLILAAALLLITLTPTAGATTHPLALVYRGPASCGACSAAVSTLLRNSPQHFTTRYVGPRESLHLVSASFNGVVLYAQPGGNGTARDAYASLGATGQTAIRSYVARGGRYLGFCMGAYLAGWDPGLGLLGRGDTGEYVGTPYARITTYGVAVLQVRWRGHPRWMFMQDGPYIIPNNTAGEHVLSTYPNGLVNALTTRYGKGRVGVVGTHPEATRGWYPNGLWRHDLDGSDAATGYDLVSATMAP